MMELAITKNTTELEQLEGVIERGLSTFYEVGRALMRIRDKQLYEKVRGIATFESYCSERWGMSRMHAHRLIDSCMVVDNVTDRLQKHPAINLEQSSSEQTAAYKNKIIEENITSKNVAIDITGGFGVDTFFLSKIFIQALPRNYCSGASPHTPGYFQAKNGISF